jgi:hypothetical protein
MLQPERACISACLSLSWPGSFVSFETALAWHGWIPEAVAITPFGRFLRRTKLDELPVSRKGSGDRITP